MKIFRFPLHFWFFMLLISSVNAQQCQDGLMALKPKAELSTCFGGDVVINNLPYQNQQNIAICSANNGWLYAVYGRDSVVQTKIIAMRSKDQGHSWQLLGALTMFGASEQIKKLNIVVVGNNANDHKLIIAHTTHTGPPYGNSDFVELLRCNCDPFSLETVFFQDNSVNHHDVALAYDAGYPALSSIPNSIGVLYSKSGIRDTIIFLSSGDGGNTFSNRKVVAVTTKKFHKVALSYGRSLTQNSGRYFAAWEEQLDTNSSVGHIYTAHTEPNYNSSFSTPVKLDGLDPELTNFCKNPSISCQSNNIDNDSANLSETIVFEKFNFNSQENDIVGFYNMKATTSNNFSRLNIVTTQNNEIQPEIIFNPFDSTFNVTYFDSTSLKLPFLSKNVNMVDPDNWNLVSSGYNDDPYLRSPNPRVSVNYATHQAITAWTKLSASNNGISMFDATYFAPVGMLDDKVPDAAKILRVFPNPCKTEMSVAFEIRKTEIVTITLYDMVGQPMAILTNQEYQCGQHQLVHDVSHLPVGIYFLIFSTRDFSTSGRICIIK